ncbi:diguanylate cyclase [Desulfovibrio sp. JC010]|uniref:sensor domain-containing diguanylate cyclase n=1 Tax=Desulfovibrio sp. JC010 TaxID=2593641 RepID=UPI0013D4FA9C|nr:diguanylate cyclase [Desulfovibrio sp. JC010]NDV28731.1 diguanylate cyclase [Desulfovibrio sp. JC010]
MTLRIGKTSAAIEGGLTVRDRLLAAISRSAEEITSGKGWPEGVFDLMAALGRITGVTRVWIFQTIELGDDYVIQDYPFEWVPDDDHEQLGAEIFHMFRSELNNPGMEEYRHVIKSRAKGEWQNIIVPELRKCWLKDILEQQGILSMLSIPIMVEGEWWGTLGFDDNDCVREWDDSEIAILRTASCLVANAVIRDRLSTQSKQFSILQGITESSSWNWDIKKGHFWCSTEILYPGNSTPPALHTSQRKFSEYLHPDDRERFASEMRNYLDSPKGTLRHELRIARKDGSYIWVEILGSLSFDIQGRPQKMSGIAIDIDDRKKKEAVLRDQAMQDTLTETANRLAFENKLSQMLNQHSDADPFAMLLMDLDYFKRINDSWGHHIGDMSLKHFADICRECLRSTDMLARIGGEEFAILLLGADEQIAMRIGERIRSTLEHRPLLCNDLEISFTVSIGCTCFSNQEQPMGKSKLYKLADQALYTAKNNGRNKIVSSNSLN